MAVTINHNVHLLHEINVHKLTTAMFLAEHKGLQEVTLPLYTPQRHIRGVEAELHPLGNLAIYGDAWLTSHPDRFTPGTKPLARIEYEAGWAPEPVYTLWKTDKYLAPAGSPTPDRPPHGLLTVVSMLYLLPS